MAVSNRDDYRLRIHVLEDVCEILDATIRTLKESGYSDDYVHILGQLAEHTQARILSLALRESLSDD